MFKNGVSKDYQTTEESVISFIVTRFSDPEPNFPLSRNVILNIFNKEFLYKLIAYSLEIAEGYRPSKESILEVLDKWSVPIMSIYYLLGMIASYKKGLRVELTDIEKFNLGYDYIPTYFKSEEYRHLELIKSCLTRLTNYLFEL